MVNNQYRTKMYRTKQRFDIVFASFQVNKEFPVDDVLFWFSHNAKEKHNFILDI